MLFFRKYNSLALILLSSIIINSCATNPVTKRKQLVFMSEEQEIELGKSSDPQIIAQFGLYEDQELQDFITEKGKAMASISHRPKLDYQFRIVDSEVLNAFAVPGGYVYFTRGIMAYFNNEAEFAGVLGHEIGHIAARHSVEQQRNQILGQIGLIAGVVLAPDLAQLAEPASQGLGLLLLKFGRDAERESDRLGVEYSSKIGYDADEMAGFFSTLEREGAKSGAGELPEFLSTHPNPGDRQKNVGKLSKEWKKKLQLSNALVNRNEYLKKIEGLVFGEDPKQGYLENSIFYHPGLRFQFSVPADWQYQNTPSQVQLASKDGKAMLLLTMAKGNDLEQAASDFLKQNNLKAIDAKETEVNGFNALAVLADAVNEQSHLRTQSYFIQYGDAIFLILGATAAADFQNYQPLIGSTQLSFKELTDAEKLNRKPERIKLYPVLKAAPLQEILTQQGVQNERLDQLAILNGMELKDPVEAGTLIKLLSRY